jgi:hypothetical protein
MNVWKWRTLNGAKRPRRRGLNWEIRIRSISTLVLLKDRVPIRSLFISDDRGNMITN